MVKVRRVIINTRKVFFENVINSVIQKFGEFDHLPFFSLIAAIGLFILATGYNGGRVGAVWSTACYWIGLFVILIPIAVRLIYPKVIRQERIGLIIKLGLCFYLVKLCYSPLEFKFPDELQHWRTETAILETNHLFSDNQSLPISPLYPGLEIVTNALINLGGLSIFNSGIVVIGISKLVFSLALYLFYEKVSKSSWVAGIASILYMANPHYLIIDSFFIYQNLALSLMALALFIIAIGVSTNNFKQKRLKFILLFVMSAIIVSHHITSYVFLFFLCSWNLAAGYVKFYKKDQSIPVWTVIFYLVMIITYIFFIAPTTIEYVGEPILGVVRDITSLITHEASVEEVFINPSGPIYERLINIGSVLLISICLLPGFWLTWRRYDKNPLALALAIGSLSYFGIIIIRVVSSDGAEIAGRSWSFVFIATSFVLAAGINETRRFWKTNILFPLGIICLFVLIFIGGIMGGWPPYWGRLPGPYLVAAFERSIEPEGVSAAQWSLDILGPGHRVAGDFTNYTLMGTYGEQDPIRNLSEVYYSSELNADTQAEIRKSSVHYLVVDKRLSSSLPMSGRYFDSSDLNLRQNTNPIEPAALAKFDYWKDVNRIFDSGNIIIYDLGVLSGAR